MDSRSVLIPTDDGAISLDAGTGTVRWTAEPSRPRKLMTTRILPLGQDVLLAFEGGGAMSELVRLDRTGDERWRIEPELPDQVALTPDASIVLARVRMASGALDLTSGQMECIGSRVRASHETISTGIGLIVSEGRASPVTAHARAGGWAESPPWQVIGRPEGLAGRLVVVQDGTADVVRGVDPASGEVRWSVPVEHVWPTYGTGAVTGSRDRAVTLPDRSTVVVDIPMELMRFVGCDVPGSRHTVDRLPPEQ